MEHADGYQKFPVFLFRVGTKIRVIAPIIKIHPPHFLQVFTNRSFVYDLYRMVSTVSMSLWHSVVSFKEQFAYESA